MLFEIGIGFCGKNSLTHDGTVTSLSYCFKYTLYFGTEMRPELALDKNTDNIGDKSS